MFILTVILNCIALICVFYYIIELTDVNNHIYKFDNPESINLFDALATLYTYIYIVISIFSISGIVAAVYLIVILLRLKRNNNITTVIILNILILLFISLNNLIFKINTWEILIKN